MPRAAASQASHRRFHNNADAVAISAAMPYTLCRKPSTSRCRHGHHHGAWPAPHCCAIEPGSTTP
ncbi:hypothetical protein UU7_07123 [Rhodanobacter spathiphylli B39]|uniref:Uncharacterized protein n=1 Tax=Rhodanobacter spathiphylli B39 TaxID=1163407 RepID=I4W336_9GAMM|nr:hypothetical protein UU7_07123 [Rhodanobacter spathiphylli B39]